MSREQLAATAGCAFSTVAKLEGGHQEPAWPLVLALAKALGVTPNDFVPEEGPAPSPAPQPAPEAAPAPKKRGRPPKGG